jgi:hypothetical protein
MKHDLHTRILALEVRYSRLGFAAIESPGRLLDVGARTYRSTEHLLRVLAPLISIFAPCVIVVKEPAHKNSHYWNGVTVIQHAIRFEAERLSIRIAPVTVDEVRFAFPGVGRVKEHVAAAVARRFPELQWRLPPRREHRPWVSEGWNMVMFDAVATGVAFMARSEGKSNMP